MKSDPLEEFRYLWDGNSHFTLHAFNHPEIEIEIVFEGEEPTIQEIIAVRKLLAKYRDNPVREIKENIGRSKTLALGVFSSLEGHELLDKAREFALTLTSKDVSYVDYLPVDEAAEAALVIEDDDLAKRVIQKCLMLACR